MAKKYRNTRPPQKMLVPDEIELPPNQTLCSRCGAPAPRADRRAGTKLLPRGLRLVMLRAQFPFCTPCGMHEAAEVWKTLLREALDAKYAH